MKEIVFSIHHHDCWGPKTVSKFPGTKIELKNHSLSHKVSSGSAIFSALWKFSSADAKELEDALNYVKSYETTKKMEVLERAGNSAEVFMVVKTYDGFAIDNIICNNCTLSEPLRIEDGMEKWSVIAEDPKRVGKLLGELHEIGEIKQERIGERRPRKDKLLTEKQHCALHLALSHGYYSWPRTITLEELAALSGTTRVTFQNHLRKAEAYTLPTLLEQSAIGKQR